MSRTRRHTLHLLAAVGFGVAGVLTDHVVALGASAPTTWSIEPATGSERDGRTSISVDLEPGQSVSDHVLLTNYGSQPASFEVYSGAGVTTDDGTFDISAEPNDRQRDVTILLTEASESLRVDVPAQSSISLPIQIHVPSLATPGDHSAAVVAELTQDPDAQLSFAARVGLRVQVRVAGDIAPSLTTSVADTEWRPSWNPLAPGLLTVTYDITNDGNVRFGADSIVTTRGPFGFPEAGASDVVREILPAEMRDRTVQIEVWPLVGTWVDVTTLAVPAGSDRIEAPLPRATASTFVWTVPWPVLLYVAGTVGLTFGVRWLRKVDRRRIEAAVVETAVPVPADGRDADATADTDNQRLASQNGKSGHW